MTRIQFSLLSLSFLMLPALALAQSGEPLPLAEAGSAEAAQLQSAHESDLQGALEDPASAARRNRAMGGQGHGGTVPTARPEPHYAPPAGYSPPAPEPESHYSPQPSGMPVGGTESDVAVGGNEPAWLRGGGNYRSPPAYRRRGSSGVGGSPKVKIVRPTKVSYIATPPFLFRAWSTDLNSRQKRILNEIAGLMKDQNADIPKLRIEAYTDNSGDAAANQALTDARASVVKAYLIAQGVGVHRLETKGFGDTDPISTNESVQGRAKNRRVEFKIVQ